MVSRKTREVGGVRPALDTHDGWPIYREALEFLEQADWSAALVLLAEAEAFFRAATDYDGEWRALLAQALLHWRQGMLQLAMARGRAALHAADAAADDSAVGVTCWQLALIALEQGDYHTACGLLRRAQDALESVGMAPPGGRLAAAAQLCSEIRRWGSTYADGQMGHGEAAAAIDAARRDLAELLDEAMQLFRTAASARARGDHLDSLLLTASTEHLALPAPTLPPPSRWARLRGWWRMLVDPAPAAPPERPAPAAPSPDPPESSAPTYPTLPDVPADPKPAPPAPAPAATTPPAGETPAPARVAPTHRTGLAIYTFGGLRVYYDDTPIERWESARARALFRYLVAHRQSPVPKERLAALFWPDSEPELARRSLHQAIYCLRQTFKRYAGDTTIVQFADDHYQIAQDVPIWLDVEEFEEALAAARSATGAGDEERAARAWATAVELYHGEFLAEERNEEWIDDRRGTLQVKYLEALHKLARSAHERGDYPSAILLCQRALTLDSCDEDAHRMLIACYITQGLRHLAVRQYQLCVSALRSQLNLLPSEEFESFYRRVVAS